MGHTSKSPHGSDPHPQSVCMWCLRVSWQHTAEEWRSLEDETNPTLGNRCAEILGTTLLGWGCGNSKTYLLHNTDFDFVRCECGLIPIPIHLRRVYVARTVENRHGWASRGFRTKK